MSKTTRLAGTSPFAHLLASTSALASRAMGRKAEDESDKDEEARKARRAEEDKQREEEDARRAEEDERRNEEDARRAEEDESDTSDENDDADADEGDDDEDDDADAKGKRAKKAKKADADDDDAGDDDSDEMKGKKAERERWTSVLGHKASGEGRIATACNMLATTDMSASAIISTLSTIPALQQAKAPGLRERMQGSRNASLGIDGGKPGGVTLASRIVAAGKKRRGEEA